MKFIHLLILSSILLCFACSRRDAVLKPSSYLADGMVLQQNSQTRLWGRATPGANVKVEVDWDCTFSTTTKNDSTWELQIVTPKTDNKKHSIILSTNDEKIVLSNVLIGEVWMAAGESMMEFPLEGWYPDTVDGGLHTIMNDEADSLLRFFKSENQYSIRPLDDISGYWIEDSPNRRGQISAISYYFAKQLRDSLNIPVGVINTTLGESRAESWLTASEMPPYAAGDYSKDWTAKMNAIAQEIEEFEEWLSTHRSQRLKYGPNGEDPYVQYKGQHLDYKDETVLMSDYDYSSWSTMMLPAKWSQTPLQSMQGICWYIKSDTIPKNWVGKDLEIHLGAIDDRDVVYFNGYEIGCHMASNQYSINRIYKVNGNEIKTNRYTIAIRVINTGGEGGFKGCSNGRMRITLADKEATPCFIDGTWFYRMTGIKRGNEMFILNPDIEELNEAPLPSWPYDESLPTVAANGMLAPFKQVGTRGVIWYQGDHNEDCSDSTYYAINNANIQTFKDFLGDDISFYQVQAIPSIEAYRGDPNSSSMLGVRNAQYKVTKSRANSGTVSTLDLGWPTYHSPYKKPIGERLARMALSRTYGINMRNDAGPEPISLSASASLLIIRFKNASGMSIDADKCQFEIAGEDGEYYTATAFIQDEDIAVFSHAVPHPTKVRYAWQNMVNGTLKNNEGLPCVAFEMELTK